MRKLLLILLTIFFVSNCSLITPAVLHIPEDPELRLCIENPQIEAPIKDGIVMLPIEDARRLRDYIRESEKCRQANEVVLRAHIEKLKNRLRAVGGQ